MTPRARRRQRQGDKPIWNWLSVLGAVLVIGAVGLKAFGRLEGSDFWATLAAGLFLIRPDKMVDMVRARWGNQPTASVAPVPPSIPDQTSKDGEA